MATQLAQVEEPGDGGTTVEFDDDSQTVERDYEAEARAHGWTPKEEFKGDESRWVDAETFVKRADEVMPLLKKQNQGMKAKMAELERTIKRLTRAEAAAYENAMADLKAKQEDAVERGDLTAHRAVAKQMETLQKEATADAEPQEDGQEAYLAFREANAWYDRAALASASEMEVEARLYADRQADKYARQGKTSEMSPTEFFALIASDVATRFPLLGKKQAREKPDSAVAGATPRARQSNARTGANLPPEAKEHAERYMRMGIYKVETKEEAYNLFAKSYTWPTN